jgi:hypothetical protein
VNTHGQGGAGLYGSWLLGMERRLSQGERPANAPASAGREIVSLSTAERMTPVTLEERIASAVALPSEDLTLRRFVQERIGKTLVRRAVREQDLQTPPKQLYSAAIEALRQGVASEEIINLMAASMDARTGHRVLPSYIDVLKQVGRDELQLLRNLPKLGRSTPMTHVNLVLPTSQAIIVYRNVLPEALADLCEFKDNIPQYVDNLTRLGLVAVRPEDEARTSSYRAMARLNFVKRYLVGSPKGSCIAMTPSTIALTDFGEGLCRACFE